MISFTERFDSTRNVIQSFKTSGELGIIDSPCDYDDVIFYKEDGYDTINDHDSEEEYEFEEEIEEEEIEEQERTNGERIVIGEQTLGLVVREGSHETQNLRITDL